MTNEELLLAKRIAEALGTENLAIVPRTGEADGLLVSANRNPNTTGAKLVWKSKDPGAKLDAIRKGVASGEIKAVLSLHEDLTRQAGFSADDLAKLEFLAVTALLDGPGTQAADVVLPGAAFAEKRGSMVNVTGRLQRLNQAIQPPGEARDDWEILADLLSALGKNDDSLRSTDDVFSLLAAEIPEFEGLTLAKIGELGVKVVETGETIPLLEKKG
jgi:NADH-quinone oxidoreductase subunit G